jgi:hypothetical protein
LAPHAPRRLSSIKPTHDRGLRERRYPINDRERGLEVSIGFHESSPGDGLQYPVGFDSLIFNNYPETGDVIAGRSKLPPARPQALDSA